MKTWIAANWKTVVGGLLVGAGAVAAAYGVPAPVLDAARLVATWVLGLAG